MPGGPWSPASPPTRPGLYINFISDALAAVTTGVRGRVAQIVRSPWGLANQGQVVGSFSDLINYFTINETAPNNAYYAGRQAFLGGAREQRLYRIVGAGSAKATATLQDSGPANSIRFDGKNVGALGNTVGVQARVNPGDATKTDLLITLGATLMATYTSTVNRGVAGHMQNLVDLVNNDDTNYLVTAVLLAAGTNIPASVTLALAGGADGAAPTAADYIALLDTVGLDSDEWDVFTVDVKNADVAGIEATINSWFATLRLDGNRVVMVSGSGLAETDVAAEASASGTNQEGVQYVYPGVQQTDSNGNLRTYRGAAFAAQVAGIRASLPLGQGMTFYPLQDVVSLERKIKGSIVDLLIKNGVTVLGKAGLSFHVVKGVTTLVTPGRALDGNPIPQGFKKVSIVNTTDAIAAAVELAARTNYVGKVPNDADGQNAVIGVVRDFLRVMAGQRAIKTNYSVDLSKRSTSDGERLYLDMAMTVVDTIDEILITVKVA